MARWVKCEAYTEDRATVWVNLDLVATIRPFENGSVLTFAAPHFEQQMEMVVWNTVRDLLRVVEDA